MPVSWVFPGDDGLVRVPLAEFKVLVFNHPGIRRFGIGVVDDGVALVVANVLFFSFKAQGPVFQFAQAVVKELVDRAGVDDLVKLLQVFVLLVEEVSVQFNRDLVILEHVFHQLGVAALRDALIVIVEVIVVVDQADRQALDDEGRQFSCLSAPLLFRVALDQLFIDVPADQRDCLLFQVLRGLASHFCPLFVDLVHGFLRSPNAPHLVEGVHVERQVVHLALIVGYRAVGVAVEFRELLDVIPDFLVGSVENVGPVLVNLDAVDFLGVDVAGDVAALFDHRDLVAALGGFAGKYSAKKPCPDY